MTKRHILFDIHREKRWLGLPNVAMIRNTNDKLRTVVTKESKG